MVCQCSGFLVSNHSSLNQFRGGIRSVVNLTLCTWTVSEFLFCCRSTILLKNDIVNDVDSSGAFCARWSSSPSMHCKCVSISRDEAARGSAHHIRIFWDLPFRSVAQFPESLRYHSLCLIKSFSITTIMVRYSQKLNLVGPYPTTITLSDGSLVTQCTTEAFALPLSQLVF